MRSFVNTKRRSATAMGCLETPFFRPQSTALHPVDLLASTWCMVPLNGHLATLFPHQVISDDEFHVRKVLKPSLLSIFKSLCINLLTGLRASLLVQHVHFQQSRERQNTWNESSVKRETRGRLIPTSTHRPRNQTDQKSTRESCSSA